MKSFLGSSVAVDNVTERPTCTSYEDDDGEVLERMLSSEHLHALGLCCPANARLVEKIPVLDISCMPHDVSTSYFIVHRLI